MRLIMKTMMMVVVTMIIMMTTLVRTTTTATTTTTTMMMVMMMFSTTLTYIFQTHSFATPPFPLSMNPPNLPSMKYQHTIATNDI